MSPGIRMRRGSCAFRSSLTNPPYASAHAATVRHYGAISTLILRLILPVYTCRHRCRHIGLPVLLHLGLILFPGERTTAEGCVQACLARIDGGRGIGRASDSTGRRQHILPRRALMPSLAHAIPAPSPDGQLLALSFLSIKGNPESQRPGKPAAGFCHLRANRWSSWTAALNGAP